MEILRGQVFECIKTVIMNGDGDIAYEKGYLYMSEEDGCITDLSGDIFHSWGVNYFSEYFKKVN